MATQRIYATELAKLLNSSQHPIYVLDDELTIVFVNRACHQWLGQAAEELLGRRCAYHSSPEVTGPEAVAAGLCPPPEVLGGREVSANVSFAPGDGPILFRRATFIPLGMTAEDTIGLVAVVDTENLAEPAAEPPPSLAEAIPQQLHDQVRRFRREMAARYRAERLLGHSPPIRRARRQIELAVGSPCSVLAVGPPGSGRQHVASAIHYGGNPAAAGSLVPIDCAVLGADLIRSTVMALSTGSALGEDTGRSTLLLNQVDQLPDDVQAELAAVLLGKPFPLRLIATAVQPLGELVRRGRFREDLATALSTLIIELPPLAEHREDLPLLAQLFLEEANARSGKQIGGFSAEALDRLDGYPWPGNVDELAQVVAESHQRAGGTEIGLGDLPERLRLAAAAAAYPRRSEETIVLDEFLRRVERELIRRALTRAKGNKAKAARLLGLARPRLIRRVKQLGLE
jgi:DNA-binding NtrC family response regulator